MLDENGNFPQIEKPFLVDAVGTVVGSGTGCTTISTFIESTIGVEAGGRTGLTAIVSGGLFLVCMLYASTQEILCKTIKKLRLKAPSDILEPQEGEIMKINRNGRITTGTFTPHTTFERWWRKYPFYQSYYEDTPTNYDDLFSVAKSFGVTADEVQALLDYGCSEEEIEEMLYDPELFHEMTGELLYAY